MSFFSRIFKGKGARATVTAINLKFMGSVHSIDGISIGKRDFDITIPFQNKIGSEMLPDSITGPKMTINSIKVSEPFQLLSVSPAPPVSIGYMERKSFSMRIRAPDLNYEGPMTIDFGNEPKDNVTISIAKIIMGYKDKRTELEESATSMVLQKSQIFKKEVQLYKVLSFNDAVNSIELNSPFELVSVDPRLPIKADRKDSYIIDIYIKAPSHNYAGPLEIIME
ncbi:MAG: hypothetical protein KGI00_04155 [Candidatus Micrarchaeota archaeon]|nr:hypothetical protein [Candidatus Micrarchaeota archaeon]MDE1849893.1 hypothetical protein [Candidatus Micrarchaeota archaeon]